MRPPSTLHRSSRATLLEIVRVVLPSYPELDESSRGAIEHDTTDYVAAQIGSMPGFLRVPFRLALFGFEILPLLRHGRPFRALPPAKRLPYLALWSDAPLAPMRDFVKLIRSTALFVYFDHPLVLGRLEAERRRGRVPRPQGREIEAADEQG